MTPAALIQQAAGDGVTFTLSARGTVKATGKAAAVNRWLSLIREHKAEIFCLLSAGRPQPVKDARPDPEAFVERAAIRELPSKMLVRAEDARQKSGSTFGNGLAPSGDDSRDGIQTVGEAPPDREAFEERAAILEFGAGFSREEAERWADDRRRCLDCKNLSRLGRCLAAARGELAATRRDYAPIRDLRRRCEGYLPGAADPDPRPGRARWILQ